MPQAWRVIWLPEATHDLERLRRFLGPKSQVAAQRAAQAILGAARGLKEHPGVGRLAEDLSDYREVFIPFGAGAYVLRYRCRRARSS